MKTKKIWIIISSLIWSSCALFDMHIPGYNLYVLYNSTENTIFIKSYSKSELKDDFALRPNESYEVKVDPLDSYQTTAFDKDTDSLFLSNGLVSKIYYCKGETLGFAVKTCNDLNGSPNDQAAYTFVSIDKKVKKKLFLAKYIYVVTPELFE